MVQKRHFSGMAGVYYVAAELSVREFIVAVTSRNAPGIDIIATNKDGKRFDIQVKTNSKSSPQSYWLLSERAKTDSAPNFFYAFVNLREIGGLPSVYIVKSKDVAENMYEDKSKKGSVWYCFDRKEEDKNRWDLLS